MDIINNKDEFASVHHNKIKKLGYWKKPRETGTLLMLMITEITKLFDPDKLNKPEKLADLALRIYDYCGYNQISLEEMPEVEECGLWDMAAQLTNEMESYRVGFNSNGQYIKACLSMAYKYASINNIDLDREIIRKSGMLDQIKKRLV